MQTKKTANYLKSQ